MSANIDLDLERPSHNDKMPPKTILVTGANGFIGYAVCRAFALAGWTTYGLMRSDRHVADLIKEEIHPLIGSPADPSAFVKELPSVVDVIATCSEDIQNYDAHFNDVLALVRQLSQSTLNASGGKTKTLVLFSSGCKDYGTTLKHGEDGLVPHTEDSPLHPPSLLTRRTRAALSMFEYKESFDCVVTRPTTLYGRSGSFYSIFFLQAEKAKKESQGVWTVEGYPNSIIHGTHVDDVASAYLALATAPREVVAGHAYNIASHRYQTVEELISVVQRNHDVMIKLVNPKPLDDTVINDDFFFNFSQWVGSDQLRKETGWVDVKPLFSEGYETYRKAYEAAAAEQSEQYQRNMRVAGVAADPNC